MGFADKYFQRVKTLPQFIDSRPLPNTEIAVVVPVYNEPDLLKTVKSLWANKFSDFTAEVFFVVNSAENSHRNVVVQNQLSIRELQEFSTKQTKENLKMHIIKLENLKKRESGVGVARKAGMDEALRRFNSLNKSDAIIVSLDADTIVQENYIAEIKKFFDNNKKICAANINFTHITSNELSKKTQKAAAIYELYLRYYVQSLRYAGFPHAFHTIGSAFAVRAITYAKHGGMVTNQSGEDFYFLQKIIPACNFGEIKTTTVFPATRITDRVIFGTGVAIEQIIKKYNFDFPVYDFNSFEILKNFFDKIHQLYNNPNIENLEINNLLKKFLLQNKIEQKLNEIKRNTTNEISFEKRFFAWFNAFRVLKFLNFSHQEYFQKKSIFSESYKLIKKYKKNIPHSLLPMLNFLKKIQDT